MAIRDLCSKKALASVMFLTGPVVAARLAVRSDLLGRVVGDKAGVPVTLVWCVFPELELDVWVLLPMLSGMFAP